MLQRSHCTLLLWISTLSKTEPVHCFSLPFMSSSKRRKSSHESRDNSAMDVDARSLFHVTTAAEAKSFTDGVRLAIPSLGKANSNSNEDDDNKNGQQGDDVIMPWMGFGTYRLGRTETIPAVLQALEVGYRAIDTAFIYGGEKTEALVGQAIQQAIERGIIRAREEVFLTTKHWRKYHGYELTQQCLKQSLRRLSVEFVDLYLMHWGGPAWSTMNREKQYVEQNPWHYATTPESNMAAVRAETWRAMEDALRQGKVRSIGVSNFTVQHLQTLKKTATIWPPAVNQVEFHPLYPQTDLLEYCNKEGIILQAYSSLGGQDTGQGAWKKLLGVPVADDTSKTKNKKKTKAIKLSLVNSEPVRRLSEHLTTENGHTITPAQVLLRWGLENGAALIPKTKNKDRMIENAGVFRFTMSKQQVKDLQDELRGIVRSNNPNSEIDELTRLSWRSDPLRHLNFE